MLFNLLFLIYFLYVPPLVVLLIGPDRCCWRARSLLIQRQRGRASPLVSVNSVEGSMLDPDEFGAETVSTDFFGSKPAKP